MIIKCEKYDYSNALVRMPLIREANMFLVTFGEQEWDLNSYNGDRSEFRRLLRKTGEPNHASLLNYEASFTEVDGGYELTMGDDSFFVTEEQRRALLTCTIKGNIKTVMVKGPE